jgi:hypothetical protein
MENKAALDSAGSLNNPKISGVLDRLHGEASRQVGGLARLLALALIDAVLRRRISSAEEARRLKHIYVPTSRKQGTFFVPHCSVGGGSQDRRVWDVLCRFDHLSGGSGA